jgi:solute carrier family 25 carnitine/acylcarnitine transporter 20/29
MFADFWAGYLSGAIGIVIGNPLDLVKVRVQAGHLSTAVTAPQNVRNQFETASSLVRGGPNHTAFRRTFSSPIALLIPLV